MQTRILTGAMLVLVAAACSSGQQRTVTVTPQGDSIISRQSQPLADVAGTLRAGTEVEAVLSQEVSSANHKVGDQVSATLTKEVTDQNGKVLFPVGSTVDLRINNLQPPMDNRETGAIGFEIASMESNGQKYRVASSSDQPENQTRDRGPFDDKQKVAIGAGAGAVAGGLITGSVKGAVVGAVLGGAAGAVINSQTGGRNVVVPQGTKVEFRLEQPAVILIS